MSKTNLPDIIWALPDVDSEPTYFRIREDARDYARFRLGHFVEPVKYRRDGDDFKKAAAELYEALAVLLRSPVKDEDLDKAEKTIRSLSWVYFATQ